MLSQWLLTLLRFSGPFNVEASGWWWDKQWAFQCWSSWCWNRSWPFQCGSNDGWRYLGLAALSVLKQRADYEINHEPLSDEASDAEVSYDPSSVETTNESWCYLGLAALSSLKKMTPNMCWHGSNSTSTHATLTGRSPATLTGRPGKTTYSRWRWR